MWSQQSAAGILEALSCVVQEFFGSIASLFRCTPHYSDTVSDCIRDRAGCTGSLMS